MLFKISYSFFYTQRWPILCLWIPVLQSKQVILIRSTPTYLRCIADQARSKYDQPTLYHRPPRCTPAQHTTWGERDHPRPFFNRLKNLSRSPRPLRAGPTNPRCILDQHTLSPIKARSLPIRPIFQSGRERGLIGSLVWTGLKGRDFYDLHCSIQLNCHTTPSWSKSNLYPSVNCGLNPHLMAIFVFLQESVFHTCYYLKTPLRCKKLENTLLTWKMTWFPR